MLRGDREQSLALAGQARDKELAALSRPGNERNYWRQATLAEAYLLLGAGQRAREHHAEAVRLAREGYNLGDITRPPFRLREPGHAAAAKGLRRGPARPHCPEGLTWAGT